MLQLHLPQRAATLDKANTAIRESCINHPTSPHFSANKHHSPACLHDDKLSLSCQCVPLHPVSFASPPLTTLHVQAPFQYTMAKQFQDKVVLITGGGSGIGYDVFPRKQVPKAPSLIKMIFPAAQQPSNWHLSVPNWPSATSTRRLSPT